jgi:uncharacterized protein (DUF2132 family)
MTSVPDEKHDPSTPVEPTTDESTATSTTPASTTASKKAPVDPLHGVTLEAMVTDLVAFFGWEELGVRIPVRCFQSDPSVPSSLKFLRKTPWARTKVEGLYLFVQRERRRARHGS